MDFIQLVTFAFLITLLVSLISYFLRKQKKMSIEIERLSEVIYKMRVEKERELELESDLQADINNKLQKLIELKKQGKSNLIEAEETKLKEQFGDKIEFLIGFSNYCLQLDKPNRAEKYLLSKEGTFGEKLRYYHYLGWFYDETGKIHKAIDALKKAEKIREDPVTFVNLSYFYWRLGEVKEAINCAEKALELNADEKTETLTKSNLAYYYAQAEIWSKKQIALDYAKYAKDSYDKYGRANLLANYGYVKMRFAQTLEEINEAIEYLTEIKGKEDIREEVETYLDEAYKKGASLAQQ